MFEIMKIIIEEKFEFLCVGKKKIEYLFQGKILKGMKICKNI